MLLGTPISLYIASVGTQLKMQGEYENLHDELKISRNMFWFPKSIYRKMSLLRINLVIIDQSNVITSKNEPIDVA